MKRIFLLAIIIGSAFTGRAQVDQMAAKKSAFLAAKAMDEALINHQYDDYVAYNHPKVLEQVEGGKSGMVTLIARQMAEIRESGNVITAVWPQMPVLVLDTAGYWQTTLPQYMEYRMPEGKIKSVTTIIGMSPDKGKTWYFMDAAGRNLSQMKAIFPELSSHLVIAPPAQPEFVSDNPTISAPPTIKK